MQNQNSSSTKYEQDEYRQANGSLLHNNSLLKAAGGKVLGDVYSIPENVKNDRYQYSNANTSSHNYQTDSTAVKRNSNNLP